MLKKIFYVFLSVLIIVCLFSGFIVRYALNDWQENNINRDNESSVNNFLYGYHTSIDNAVVTAQQLASLIDFDGEFKEDTTKLLSDLTTVTKINKKFMTAFVVNLDGDVFSTSANGIIPNLNAKKNAREYYTSIVDDKKTFNITAPFYSKNLGKDVISVSVPIYRDEKLIGVFGGSINFSSLVPSTEMDFKLTNNDGVILVSSELNDQSLSRNIYSIEPTYKTLTPSPILMINNNDKKSYSISKVSINGGILLFPSINQDTSISMGNRIFYVVLFVFLGSSIILSFSVFLIIKKELNLLPTMVSVIKGLADGKINKLNKSNVVNNEFKLIFDSIYLLVDKLLLVIKSSVNISDDINSYSNKLILMMDDLSANIQSELAQVEVISTAISELSSTSKEVSINAEQAENETRKAIDNVKEGNIALEQSITLSSSINSSVQETANLIEELKDRAIDIGEVTNVISSISDQINLLALNAAIEAARAGEHGRGFAVVADEVRNLAAKTQESTKNIQEIISALQDKSENANSNMIANVKSIQESKELSDLVKKSFDDISYSVQAISDINTLVATASREQYSVTEDIAKNVTVTFDLVNENVVSVNQTQKAAQELTTLAEKQNQALSFFKLSN